MALFDGSLEPGVANDAFKSRLQQRILRGSQIRLSGRLRKRCGSGNGHAKREDGPNEVGKEVRHRSDAEPACMARGLGVKASTEPKHHR